jgi:hypothetical protein
MLKQRSILQLLLKKIRSRKCDRILVFSTVFSVLTIRGRWLVDFSRFLKIVELCFHDRSDPLFQDKVLDMLRSTMFQSLSLVDIDRIVVHAFTIGEEGFDVSMIDKVALIITCQSCTVTHIRQCHLGLYAHCSVILLLPHDDCVSCSHLTSSSLQEGRSCKAAASQKEGWSCKAATSWKEGRSCKTAVSQREGWSCKATTSWKRGRSCKAVVSVEHCAVCIEAMADSSQYFGNKGALSRAVSKFAQLKDLEPQKYECIEIDKRYEPAHCVPGNPTFSVKREDLGQWVKMAEEYCPPFLVRLVDAMQPYLLKRF